MGTVCQLWASKNRSYILGLILRVLSWRICSGYSGAYYHILLYNYYITVNVHYQPLVQGLQLSLAVLSCPWVLTDWLAYKSIYNFTLKNVCTDYLTVFIMWKILTNVLLFQNFFLKIVSPYLTSAFQLQQKLTFGLQNHKYNIYLRFPTY